MIPPRWRFYSPFGALLNGGPWTWTVIDWDLRKWFNIVGTEKSLPEYQDAIKVLARHIDTLGPEVHSLTISDDCELLSVSPKDNPTLVVDYPPYLGPLDDHQVLRRMELTEVDRLGVAVDLVRLPTTSLTAAGELVVFKYTLIQERVLNIWDELNILKALQGHTSFVPFHRIILDDVGPSEPRVVGFTMSFISSGNLEDLQACFYFRWLHQLTAAVDDLNLKFGIMHQDIAPRNVLVDPITKNLRIFDFDRAAKIGTRDEMPGRSDVDGVIFTVYETLTKDQHYRSVLFDEKEVHKIEQLSEWDLKVELEEGKGGLSAYRQFLGQWAAGRRTTRKVEHYSVATNPLDWPEAPPGTPRYIRTGELDQYGYICLKWTGRRRKRFQALQDGEKVICWERGSQTSTPHPPTVTVGDNERAAQRCIVAVSAAPYA